MLRTAIAAILGSTLALGLVGCFDQPEPACTFACGGEADDECPEGYSCVTGAAEGDPSICVRADLEGDGLAACDPEVVASAAGELQ